MEVALVRREVARLGAVREPVGDADLELVEGREDVELRQRERRDPVQAHRVAERDEIEPAGAAVAAGDGAVLLAELAHLRRQLRLHLARERAGADPRHVRLRDADHAVDPRRPDPDPRRRRTGDRVRRGDERIRAVVEVEQRPLRALEQDAPDRRGSPRRRAATCRRRTAAAAARSPRSGRRRPRARTARARRRARARCSSRPAPSRSSGAGSSRRAGPGRGCRDAPPCRRTPARSRGASSRSGACRAASRPRRRWRCATA